MRTASGGTSNASDRVCPPVSGSWITHESTEVKTWIMSPTHVEEWIFSAPASSMQHNLVGPGPVVGAHHDHVVGVENEVNGTVWMHKRRCETIGGSGTGKIGGSRVK